MARAAAVAIAGGLALVTALIGAEAEPGTAPLRHAYFVPVVAGALTFGGLGGLATALGAAMLDAPFVFAEIERTGLTRFTGEPVVTLVLLLLVGALAGSLTSHARSQRWRADTLVAIHEAVSGDQPFAVALDRVRDALARRVHGAAVALAVQDDEGVVLSGVDRLHPGSPAAVVLEDGAARFVPDLDEGGPLHRAAVLPLGASASVVGVLMIERRGELTRRERAEIGALGAYVGLGLENARLAARQRRFADELAERVATATRRLQQLDQAKSAFVAIASHELRTPLTALLGYSELLATRTPSPAEVRRMANIVRAETERLVRIVDDLLDLSRLERGVPPGLRRTAVAPAAAIAAAVEVMRRVSPRHCFITECAGALPEIHADADALDRILKNLIANAVKYSRPGSVIRVRARADGADAGVCFSVEDQGRGIAADALSKVFEPYYRTADATSAAPGAGLGLAVVKALVEAHGGSIEMQSAPALGTRVAFVIPRVS